MTALRIERAGAAAARVSGDLGFADAAAAICEKAYSLDMTDGIEAEAHAPRMA